MIFVLCVVGLAQTTRRAARQLDPAAGLLAAFGVFPALVFIQHAFGDRVQGNWPEVIYPAAVIAAAMLPLAMRWLRPALAVGFTLTLVIYAQAIASPIPIGGVTDPTIRVLGGWPSLARAVERAVPRARAHFVAIDEYGLGSELALRLPASIPVIADDRRWLLFNLPHPGMALTPGETGLLIRTTRRRTPPDARPWASMTDIGELDRGRYGRIGETYRVYSVTVGPGADALVTRLPSGAQK